MAFPTDPLKNYLEPRIFASLPFNKIMNDLLSVQPLPLFPLAKYIWTPNDYLNYVQNQIVWNENPYKIVQGVRQSGKTRIIVEKALLSAFFTPNQTILIISPTHNMIESVRHSINDRIYSSDERKSWVKVNRRDTIVFNNGSKIMFCAFSNYKSHICGENLDTVLIDEAALLPDKFTTFNAVTDLFVSVSLRKGEMLLVSTRKNRSKKNLFWNYWLSAVAGESPFMAYVMSLKDTYAYKHKGWASSMRMASSRSRYDTEFTIRMK